MALSRPGPRRCRTAIEKPRRFVQRGSLSTSLRRYRITSTAMWFCAISVFDGS
jgi:hypothetical protein